MTWGNKLVLVFIAFAALMSTLVYKCMKQNFELVSKDYYADELRYQDKIDGMNNANKISALLVTQDESMLTVQLPKELEGLALKGDAWFYCPTNSLNDRRMPITVDEGGKFHVVKSRLAQAKYVVKFSWTVGEDKYHVEREIEVKG